MNTPYVFKKCTKCGRWLVASTVNFYKQKGGKYELKAECKECLKTYNNKYCVGDIEPHKKEYPDEYKKCTKCGRILPANTDNFHRRAASKDGLDTQCKKCKNASRQRNYQANIERERTRRRQYKKKRNEYFRNYFKTPHGQVIRFNGACRRRQREEQQGTGINTDQWVEMMKFFDWRCAYSGITLNCNNRSIDHIMPLVKGGENEIWNCVPMYKPYNSSKQEKNLEEWYPQQDFYDENKLNKIKEWCKYSYNKWGKNVK